MKSDYKIKSLVFWCVVGVLLFTTWSLCFYWRPADLNLDWWSCPFSDNLIGGFWQSVDEGLFFSLNGSLGAEKNSWNLLWAIANYRGFDMLAAVFMFIILVMYGRAAGEVELFKQRVAIMLGCIVYVVLSSQVMKLFMMPIDRESATIVYKAKSILLGDLYPNIDPKDSSSNSFPGDHAIILIGYTIAMFRYGKLKYGVPAMVVTVVFALPRLVGGAHWLTDIVVGGGFVTMLSMSVFFCTPLYRKFEPWSVAVMNKLPLVDRFAKLIVK